MKISVVIPTFKRPELLKRCLTALLQQSFSRNEFEVVVADNAGDQWTREIVKTLSSTPDIQIIYVDASDADGPAHARNVGVSVSRGEIIAFADDDTIPDQNWLKEGVKVFESDEHITAMSGKTLVPISDDPTDHELNESHLASADFVTANCFCRREALNSIGGFDERFTKPWREDSDLHFRLVKNGFKVARADRAVVVHPVRPAGFGVSLLQQKKVMQDALLFKKHPGFFRRYIGFFAGRYYLSLAAFMLTIAFAVAGNFVLTTTFACIWTGITAAFCFSRLRKTSRRPLHVLEMLLTSIVIPPTAVFWRVYGAIKFRVLFF
jgi:cellulose synthase/poly-beta-1,6-N-acetylglucosamine synthase-like glycosyltransferase